MSQLLYPDCCFELHHEHLLLCMYHIRVVWLTPSYRAAGALQAYKMYYNCIGKGILSFICHSHPFLLDWLVVTVRNMMSHIKMYPEWLRERASFISAFFHGGNGVCRQQPPAKATVLIWWFLLTPPDLWRVHLLGSQEYVLCCWWTCDKRQRHEFPSHSRSQFPRRLFSFLNLACTCWLVVKASCSIHKKIKKACPPEQNVPPLFSTARRQSSLGRQQIGSINSIIYNICFALCMYM